MKTIGLKQEEASLYSKAWVDSVEKSQYLKLDTLQQGAVELLSSIKKKGFNLVLLTLRENQDGLKRQLQNLGISDLFSEVYSISHKEGREGKVKYLKKTEASLFVGDTEVDYLSAKDAGVPFYPLSNGCRSEIFWKDSYGIADTGNLNLLMKELGC